MCDEHCTSADGEVFATPGATTPQTDALTSLAQAIVDLLRRPELARVSFVVEPTTVDAAAFQARACEIERHLLHIAEVAQPPVGDACYQSRAPDPEDASDARSEVTTLRADTLYVKEDIDLTRVLSRALVLHELVHATQDAGHLRTDVFHAEVAAYTLQAMVFLVFGTTWSADVSRARPPLPTDPAALAQETERRRPIDALVAASESAARELLAGPRGATMRTEHVDAIITALRGMRYYETHGELSPHFDGITPPTTTPHRRGRRR
jgi:hypothetical protein